jgi:hypothetical protein
MGKVKTIYRILVPVLVVLGMALSPFLAMETVSAFSVSNAWPSLRLPQPGYRYPDRAITGFNWIDARRL